jgi:hypothetical protein
MNERIKELAHKADFIIKKNNGAEWRWGHIDPELAEKLEKFAELIVLNTIKDCRDVFVVSSVSWNLLNEKLKHFGVEE